MSLPQSVNIEGKDIPIMTFKQLEQKPRLTLKNIAMNLRDAIGAERLPALRAAGSLEEVTFWIIDVQCMLAKAVGVEITPNDLGLPSGYGAGDAGLMGGGQQAQSGGPGAQPEFAAQPAHAAMAAAAATKAKNQRGSNIFGGDDVPAAPKAYQQQRQPMQPLDQGGPEMAAMAAYNTAMDQAAATRARNQRGSNIFG